MALKISDRFYEPYSFALDFGRSGEQEIEFIKDVIEERGFSPSISNVKDSLTFLKNLSVIIRDENTKEIKNIQKTIKKEIIAGGVIPPDIFIAYEVYKDLIDLAAYGVTTFEITDKISGDRLSKIIKKALSKLLKNKRGKSLISRQLKKIRNWKKINKKRTRRRTVKKPQKSKKSKRGSS